MNSIRTSSELQLSRRPHVVILPGRTMWIYVCHANPVVCDDCLHAVAEFLAVEMHWEMSAALNKTTESYQAELGEDLCSLERARDLRRMTCQECLPPPGRMYDLLGRTTGVAFPERPAEMVVADCELVPLAVSPVGWVETCAEPMRAAEVYVGPTRWQRVRKFAVGCVLWPCLIALGGVYFAAVLGCSVLACLGAGEER